MKKPLASPRSSPLLQETTLLLWQFLALLVLAVIPFVIYGNSLHSPFVADDLTYIVHNPEIRALAFPGCLSTLRPLTKFTYWLNQVIHGSSLPGYHLVNIACFAAASVLLFFVYRRLLVDYALARAAPSRGAASMAFAGALLFELHPIHTQAVNYTFARSELLCALFLFAALFVYARRGGTGMGRAVLVSLLLLLALASKERAFMFVPALVLFDLWVRREETRAERLARWRRLAIPMGLVVGLGLVNFYYGFRAQHWGGMGQGREVPDLVPYFLTEMMVRLHYLKLYVWPADLAFAADFTLRSRLGDPVLLAAIGVHLVVLLVALLAVKKDGRVAWGIFWFFLLLLPTSGPVPAAILMHEHWLLLPSLGVFLVPLVLLQGALGSARWRRLPRPAPWVLAVVFIALCLQLGRASHRRNRVWQDSVSLWRDAAIHSPTEGWVWNNLGTALLEKRDFAPALQALEKARKYAGPNAATSHNLGLCLIGLRRYDEALQHFEDALRQSPDRPEIILGLGQLHRRMGNPGLAVDYLRRASLAGFTTYELYLAMAELQAQSGETAKAAASLEEGLRRFPQSRELHDALQRIRGERR